VTAYAGYRHVEPILQGNRDFSSCTLNSGDTFAAAGCGGFGHRPSRPASATSSSTPPARATRSAAERRDRRPTTSARRTTTSVPTTATSWAPSPNYEINDVGHGLRRRDVLWTTRSTVPDRARAASSPAPSRSTGQPVPVAQQRGLLAGHGGSGGGTCATNPAGTVTGIGGAPEQSRGGGRQSRTEHTQYRYVIGPARRP
jgi:hypothetical protein